MRSDAVSRAIGAPRAELGSLWLFWSVQRCHIFFSKALLYLAQKWQVLNVQVPFYFKSIVDSMNIDFVAIGGTAWTVGGAMIVACMKPVPIPA